METNITTGQPSKVTLWIGRVLSGLIIAFLLFDGVMKIFPPESVIKASAPLGFTGTSLRNLGIILTVSTLLYANPLTSVLGAIIITGYLGGAVACQLRIGASPFAIGFPVMFAALMWLGLLLRDQRLQTLLPMRR
jgi:hypothetical protein